jgi:hypothetical protein
MSLSQEDTKALLEVMNDMGVKNDSQFREAVQAIGIGKGVINGCKVVAEKFKLDEEEVLNTFKKQFESTLELVDRDVQELLASK